MRDSWAKTVWVVKLGKETKKREKLRAKIKELLVNFIIISLSKIKKWFVRYDLYSIS
jgi:hypothetical protein